MFLIKLPEPVRSFIIKHTRTRTHTHTHTHTHTPFHLCFVLFLAVPVACLHTQIHARTHTDACISVCDLYYVFRPGYERDPVGACVRRTRSNSIPVESTDRRGCTSTSLRDIRYVSLTHCFHLCLTPSGDVIKH